MGAAWPGRIWAESRRTLTRTLTRALTLALSLSRYLLSGVGGDKGAAPPFSFLNLVRVS